MTRSSRVRASYYFYRSAIGCFDESQSTAVPELGPAGLRVTLLAAWVVLALLNSSVNLSVAEERSVAQRGRVSYAKGFIRALGADGDCRNADGVCVGDRLIP